MTFVGGHFGFMKKVYLRRFALHALFSLGVQEIVMTEEIDDKTLSLENRMFGGSANIGMEYALNIDTNVGLTIGYRGYPIGYWLLRYDDKRKSFETPIDLLNPEKPIVFSDGLEVGFYIHYSLPSLPGELTPSIQPSKVAKLLME